MGSTYKLVRLHDAEAGTADGTTLEINDYTTGCAGYVVGVQLTGISGETITWEATIDGENWVAFRVEPLATGTFATTATANGLYRVEVSGLLKFRARISTGGSGAVTCWALLDMAG
jgi:hypothetical protein